MTPIPDQPADEVEADVAHVAKAMCRNGGDGHRSLEEYVSPSRQLWMRYIDEAKVAIAAVRELDHHRSRQPSAEGEGTEACAKIVDATADASPPESLVWTSRSLASDAYDRFVMGGWEPEDFVSTIKEWAQKERIHALRLAATAIRARTSPRPDEEK